MSVAADLAGLHPQTLRLYERRGLVEPARTGGGNRRYSEADLDQLRRIATLTEAGVNIEGVRRVLELEAEVARLTRALEQARRAAKAVSIRSALKR
jgi:MerR family transcriptional regulator/heat shock protein HspR